MTAMPKTKAADVKFSARDASRIVGKLDFKGGMVTAVAIDHDTKEVLLVAFMNKEAALRTLQTGLMHYWSRSRHKLWMKGEKTDHVQRVKGVRVDCDVDALLFDVEQVGDACHRGHRSCFHRDLREGKLAAALKPEFDRNEVYR